MGSSALSSTVYRASGSSSATVTSISLSSASPAALAAAIAAGFTSPLSTVLLLLLLAWLCFFCATRCGSVTRGKTVSWMSGYSSCSRGFLLPLSDFKNAPAVKLVEANTR